MSDQAIKALQTYDWGVDPAVLQPISDAVISTRGDAAARRELESKLAAVLKTDAPRAAKDYVGRQLRTIGTAASVPALAALLADEELSHMARYALERIPGAEAGDALRKALPGTRGTLKIGIISSLGVRGEESSVEALGNLLADQDEDVARAAAYALGAIGTASAVGALAAAKERQATTPAIGDALLTCAEAHAAKGNGKEARSTYELILERRPSGQVRLAAERALARE